MAGRYVTSIRGGIPPLTAAVSGTLVGPLGEQVAGSPVSLCSTLDPSRCHSTSTDSQGTYTLKLLAEDVDGAPHTLTHERPPGEDLGRAGRPHGDPRGGPGHPGPADGVRCAPAACLPAPRWIPPGRHPGGSPVIYWQTPVTFTTHACPNAQAFIDINSGEDGTGDSLIGGWQAMTESPAGSGQYHYAMAPLYPNHGWTTVTFQIQCPGSPFPDTVSFNLYIDPSGNVFNANGNRIRDARVPLYRSDSAYGPFELVPDGSAIMSPTNRQNPMFSDVTGYFGWDTVPGFYVVRAEKPGCTDAANAQRPYVETDVLPVPPPVTGLQLVLDCSAVPPPVLTVPSRVTVEAASAAGTTVSYEASATDAADGALPISCLPLSGSLLPLGTTWVTCSSVNSSGQEATTRFPVEVRDSTPPALNLPGAIAVAATSAAGTRVSFNASAQDGIDGAVSPVCTPSSGSLFAPGETAVHCTATDSHGNVSQGSFPVRVTFQYGGLLPPLSDSTTSIFHRNQVIPVRFTLAGASASVSTLAPRLFIAPTGPGGTGPEQPAERVGRGGNIFDSHGPLGRSISST